MFLGLYLNEVLPHEFGVQKHPLFCFKQCKKRQGVEEVYKDVQDQSKFTLRYKEHELEVNLGQEDTDVKNESRRIEAMEEPYANAALIVKGITKIYDMGKGKQPKIAVKHMNLVVERGEMFGLLGPNGAGKTTLISILTGLYQPDCGNAWVSGYDIVNSLDNVQLRMGVCPQFDILWPELTVYEHLLFYARVKGISSKYEHQKVREAMDEVHLGKFSHLKSTALSGGMKRRLSVAIALVGDPKIVFLDEPTTGLDPENRRQLWDILAKCKIGRAMVLTTHLMEEADVLCNRIGIQDHGVLRCVGNSQHLKNLYGGGYHLYINVHKQKYIERLEDVQFSIVEEAIQLVKAFVSDLLPHANLATDFNGSLIYLVPLEGTLVSDIFAAFEEKKDSLGIADWGISQSSLEDVFLNVIDETSNIG